MGTSLNEQTHPRLGSLNATNNEDPTPTCIHVQLREKWPVAWTDAFGGFYTLTPYEDVADAALDHETFSNVLTVSIPSTTDLNRKPHPPIEVDAPENRAVRDVLNRHFTPDRMWLIEPAIRRGAGDLLGSHIARR